MTSTHSPGPWQWTWNMSDEIAEVFATEARVAVCDVWRRPLANEFDSDRKLTQVANAYLIAAAPDMLAALQRQAANIARWLETGIPAGPEESRQIAEQINAAISKATRED